MLSRFCRSLPTFLHRLDSRPYQTCFSTPIAAIRTMSTDLEAARAHVAEQVKVDLFTLTQDEVGCSACRTVS